MSKPRRGQSVNDLLPYEVFARHSGAIEQFQAIGGLTAGIRGECADDASKWVAVPSENLIRIVSVGYFGAWSVMVPRGKQRRFLIVSGTDFYPNVMGFPC